MSPLTRGPQRTKSAWPLNKSLNATGVRGERFADVAADEAGAASDENFHGSIFSLRFVGTVSIVCTRRFGRPSGPPRA
jgi:hypothetical protein